MSLLRELAANFGQITSVLTAQNFEAAAAFADSLGGLVLNIPAVPEETSVTMPAALTSFVSASTVPVTVVFDPANMFVGRLIFGVQRGSGSVTFSAVDGVDLTIYDASGGTLPLNSPSIYQGGCGIMICVEKTATSLVMQGCGVNFGQTPVAVVPAGHTGNYVVPPGVRFVVSRATTPYNLLLNPSNNCPPGATLNIINTANATITLGAQSGTVTFIAQNGSSFTPAVNFNASWQFVVIEHTPGTCVLQAVYNA